MTPSPTLVIGGGIAGLSTAWHLARDGAEVLLVEREGALGTHSTALNAAVLRTVGPDPAEVVLAQAGAASLREPPAGFAEVPLVERRGLILAAERDGGALADQVAAAAPRTRARELAAEELSTLAPWYRQGSPRAWLFPDEGRIAIDPLVEGFARGARDAGAELRTDCGVEEVLTEGSDSDRRVVGARLGDGSVVPTEAVVLAAGGWASRLGRHAGSRVELAATRRHLLVTLPVPGVDPDAPVVWDLDEDFYLRPEAGGLLLCACDESPADPDALAADPGEAERILGAARRHLDLALPEAADFWCGVRTFASDRRFVIGADPDVRGLVWAAALGGAGMCTASEVGRLATASVRALSDDRARTVLAADPGAEAVSPARWLPAERS